MNKRLIRRLVLVPAVLSLMVVCAWGFTNLVIASARANGEYASAGEGMLALMDKSYPPDHTVKIHYVGPNEHDGSKPYVWYVIAEVHASPRAHGSEPGHNDCKAPGSFLLQLKDGKGIKYPKVLLELSQRVNRHLVPSHFPSRDIPLAWTGDDIGSKVKLLSNKYKKEYNI